MFPWPWLVQNVKYVNFLAVGKYSKAVVAASRKAVKDDNPEALIKILQMGDC